MKELGVFGNKVKLQTGFNLLNNHRIVVTLLLTSLTFYSWVYKGLLLKK